MRCSSWPRRARRSPPAPCWWPTEASSVPELPRAYDLSGRVAVVTGGAGMLGREHAAALIETGARVALLDLPGDRLEAAAGELDAQPLGCDLTSGDSVRAARDDLIERLGRVDILVNNAANDPKV